MATFSKTFKPSQNRRSSDSNVHVNMAPMIDFLIMTIAYLLISASYCSIGLIDSTAQASGISDKAQGSASQMIGIIIQKDHSLRLGAIGSDHFETFSPDPNFTQIIQRLKAINASNTPVKSVALNADADVNYGEMIQLLDHLRSFIPQVTLSTQAR